MALALELQLDAVVDEAFPLKSLADPDRFQEVDRPLFEHARADALLEVLATLALEDDRVDSLQVQELSEHEAGWTGSHDPDLRALASQPQISWAVSTMSRSLATCWS